MHLLLICTENIQRNSGRTDSPGGRKKLSPCYRVTEMFRKHSVVENTLQSTGKVYLHWKACITRKISESNPIFEKYAFVTRDMSVQGAILGLETRDSEKRSGRQPLEEVNALNERNFFTRSVRKSRDGYVVFVYDRKTESGPGEYLQASFSDLYTGYTEKLHGEIFLEKADEVLRSLTDGNSTFEGVGVRVSISRKSDSGVRAEYDKKNGSLTRELTKLQNERTEISDAERENNATSDQLAKKEDLDNEIEKIREEQAALNRERSLAVRLADACPSLVHQGPWEELERTGKEILFARLDGVYSIKPKVQGEDQVSNRVLDLEFARAERTRGKLIQDLIEKELSR